MPSFGAFADFGEPFIKTVLFDQFFVGSLLDDFAVIHHQNAIGTAHRGKTAFSSFRRRPLRENGKIRQSTGL